jgi:hypothetical protein
MDTDGQQIDRFIGGLEDLLQKLKNLWADRPGQTQ